MPTGHVELGYSLKRSSWGKGIATEVCRRLLKFAFEETSLEEIVATIDDERLVSKKILEKASFVYKGRIHPYGEDSADFRISRQKWFAENKHR